jgi:hypothetical protein
MPTKWLPDIMSIESIVHGPAGARGLVVYSPQAPEYVRSLVWEGV